MSVLNFIAIVSTLGALAVEGVSIIRQKKSEETLVLPPDITNDVLEDGRFKEMVDRLPISQLECLEGKDSACTKSMAAIKQTLKKALIDDCSTCAEEEKRSAGFVLASLLFYHPETWNRMLSRYNAGPRYQRYLSPEMKRASRQRRFFQAAPPGIIVPESIALRPKPLFSAKYELLS